MIATMKQVFILGGEKEKNDAIASFLSSQKKRYNLNILSSFEAMLLKGVQSPPDLIVLNQNSAEKSEVFKNASFLCKRFRDLSLLLFVEDIECSYAQIAEIGLSHVLPIRTPVKEVQHTLIALLEPTETVGIGRYLHHASDVPPFSYGTEEGLNEIRDIILAACEKIPSFSHRGVEIETVVYETMINGFFHSFHNGNGRMPGNSFLFQPTLIEEKNKLCRASYGYDNEKMVISIMDRFGILEKETILKKIARQISGKGVLDVNGRGLFLCYKGSDRIIYNICPGEFCEVLLFFYYKQDNLRSIQINTIPSSCF